MRTLTNEEVLSVSGAGKRCCYIPPKCDKIKHANNGFGNGPFDGVPGKSDHTDDDR